MPTAAELAPLVNAYTLRPGPPKTLVVPGAASLAALQDTLVAATLLKKQVIALDPRTGGRAVSLGAVEFSLTPGVPVALSVTLKFRVQDEAAEKGAASD